MRAHTHTHTTSFVTDIADTARDFHFVPEYQTRVGRQHETESGLCTDTNMRQNLASAQTQT